MSLLRDMTRCLGEGATGAICRKREQCQRHMDIPRPGDRLVFAQALCRDDRFEAWIPVEKEARK